MNIGWLKGIKILLLGNYVPAPLAAWQLQMLGAEIIKVEPPFGDLMRQQPPFLSHQERKQSAFFIGLNAGFQSISINLKHPTGIDLLKNLWAECDCVLDGNRAGYIEKLWGMHPPDALPGTVYIPVTGYGTKGPRAPQAAHDNNALAIAGLMSYATPSQNGGPAAFGAPAADMAAASAAVICALAGILARQRNPGPESEGLTADTSILHAAFFQNALQLSAMAATQKSPVAGKEWMNGGLPQYHAYPTADGRFVFFGALEPHFLRKFLELQGRLDLLSTFQDDPEKAKTELTALFQAKNSDEWRIFSNAHDVCLTVVNTLEEALKDPQIQALGLAQPSKIGDAKSAMPIFPAGFGKESLMPTRPTEAPAIGADSRKICSGMLGMPESEISSLFEEGVLTAPESR